jgi:uncharacterized membrane protein (DUF2068 family)
MTLRKPRPAGLKLIVTYKFVKSPLVLGLAVWLTAAPHSTYDFLQALVRVLDAAGTAGMRLGSALQGELTQDLITGGAILAWLDGVSTVIEGGLLLSGWRWAQWLVIVELGCLVPIGGVYWVLHPGPGKLIALLVNAAIVAYLVWQRLREGRAHNNKKV